MIVGLCPVLALAANGTQQAPKLLNLFLDYYISDEDPVKLAKWDIVVLDMDQSFQFPDKVRRIKAINPRVKILAYVSVGEISAARFREDARAPGYRMASRIPESWFMHHADGARASWWAGTYQMNVTDLGPTDGGQRWNTFVGPFIRDEILSSGLWDGVFLDSAYGEVAERFGMTLDPDSNGVANGKAEVDAAWRAGMAKLMRGVREAIGPDKMIMNNSSAAYAALSNGVLFENFTAHGWAWPFAELRRSLSLNASPKISAVNVNTGNEERPDDFRRMRYGLASALVADGFFSFDAGDQKHHRTWWYDEYETALGSPRGAAKVEHGSARGAQPAVWSRAYERGMVLVNGTARAETVHLPGTFERLRGVQDPTVNSGEIVQRVTVPAEDGLLLYRRSDTRTLREVTFIEGTFYAMYAADGTRSRNGFFASRDDVPSGATVWSGDLDQDDDEDTVTGKDGEVVMRLTGSSPVRVRPFGSRYRGRISLAVIPAAVGRAAMIAVSSMESSSPSVVVLDEKGRIRSSFSAYRPAFLGGASVSVRAIGHQFILATAPGRGGGPHIRFFQPNGTPFRGGFFAFSEREAGGAFSAWGDVDGDGAADLVVGSGAGTPSRIRVYDGNDFHLKKEFAVAGGSSDGARIVVVDTDGDGTAEILVPSSPF